MSTGRKILVIDDEVDIGEILTDLLQSSSQEVVFASTPEKAKELLQDSSSYDLIISDVSMPNIPGPELIRIVRSQGNLIPVMFLTGFASKETVLTALRLGVSDVIEKPFDSNQLLLSIERVLEIGRRKDKIVADEALGKTSEAQIKSQKKMLGLMYVVNEKKKVS